MPYPPKPFCKKGHEKAITGIGKRGQCLECQRLRNANKTLEKKEELAKREAERRANEKLRLSLLPVEEAEAIREQRRAEDRARRAAFKLTLSEDEILRRKAEAAAYDAVKYLKEKELFLQLPIEEQERIRAERREYRRLWWEENGEEQRQKRRDRIAAMSHEEYEEHKRKEKEYQTNYYWDNREDILEKNRLLRLERGHIYNANKKAKLLALSPEDQAAIKLADSLYHKNYYIEHRDEILASKKAYYQNNRETILTNKHQYYLDHIEERRAYNKAYYNLNALELNEKNRTWYEENKEQALEARRRYKEKYPEKVKASEKACRANRRGAPGKITAKDVQDAVEASEGRCPYCIKELVFGEIHIDHMQPLSRGGWNSRDNIVACCAECNLRKNDKTVKEFVFGLRYGDD